MRVHVVIEVGDLPALFEVVSEWAAKVVDPAVASDLNGRVVGVVVEEAK